MSRPTPEDVLRAPKVLLHDHLDGGLRPATVVELADAAGYTDLPTTDAGELGRWFTDTADAGSLPEYLSTFAHTVGVMQSEDALVRVARECAEDLAADGVVYAEVRFAPSCTPPPAWRCPPSWRPCRRASGRGPTRCASARC